MHSPLLCDAWLEDCSFPYFIHLLSGGSSMETNLQAMQVGDLCWTWFPKQTWINPGAREVYSISRL